MRVDVCMLKVYAVKVGNINVNVYVYIKDWKN